MRRSFVFLGFIIAIAIVLFNCKENPENPYKNISDTSAQYVGMEACRQCHEQVYETFIQTGMGQSWGIATKAKSAADYNPSKALVYDSVKDFYYKPFWDGDSLAILEYRLNGRDTTHKRLEKVSYIVGSGQHTNSHILNINGYLHQAPITFYTQKGKWDLAPGYEQGMNSRFERKIELECISCHNGYPGFVNGSLNKYTQVKLGIDCERCHGPGSLHVAEKKKGIVVDTSQTPDYTIVNPRRLTTTQQNNLCMRCHLQGISVLNTGKTFLDFKPTELLSQTMNTFMPTYSGNENKMIMASHVERMMMSQCYIQSKKMSCISCHNPHVSVKNTATSQYNTACKNCHTSNSECNAPKIEKEKVQDNCVQCHMAKNTSIDIPHVAVTDHYIRKKINSESTKEISKFIGLLCYNNSKTDARTQARAFLEFYERYEQNPHLLDSAETYLTKAGIDIETQADIDYIRILFLKEAYSKITVISKELPSEKLKDAWTAYRIGESFQKEKKYNEAISYLQKSVELKPFALDFKNKLSTTYLSLRKWEDAKKTSLEIIKENPRYANAYFNLGYIAMEEQNILLAQKYFQTAIMLNPDHVQSLINLAVVYYRQNKILDIIPLLKHAAKLDPTNEQIKAMLRDVLSK